MATHLQRTLESRLTILLELLPLRSLVGGLMLVTRHGDALLARLAGDGRLRYARVASGRPSQLGSSHLARAPSVGGMPAIDEPASTTRVMGLPYSRRATPVAAETGRGKARVDSLAGRQANAQAAGPAEPGYEDPSLERRWS
jgi:hypothetical protein